MIIKLHTFAFWKAFVVAYPESREYILVMKLDWFLTEDVMINKNILREKATRKCSK